MSINIYFYFLFALLSFVVLKCLHVYIKNNFTFNVFLTYTDSEVQVTISLLLYTLNVFLDFLDFHKVIKITFCDINSLDIS